MWTSPFFIVRCRVPVGASGKSGPRCMERLACSGGQRDAARGDLAGDKIDLRPRLDRVTSTGLSPHVRIPQSLHRDWRPRFYCHDRRGLRVLHCGSREQATHLGRKLERRRTRSVVRGHQLQAGIGAYVVFAAAGSWRRVVSVSFLPARTWKRPGAAPPGYALIRPSDIADTAMSERDPTLLDFNPVPFGAGKAERAEPSPRPAQFRCA